MLPEYRNFALIHAVRNASFTQPNYAAEEDAGLSQPVLKAGSLDCILNMYDYMDSRAIHSQPQEEYKPQVEYVTCVLGLKSSQLLWKAASSCGRTQE